MTRTDWLVAAYIVLAFGAGALVGFLLRPRAEHDPYAEPFGEGN